MQSSTMNYYPFPTESKSSHRRCDSSVSSSNTYKQAIVEIYESLYNFQRERTGEQEAQVVDCITKWYEFNAVFENPFTRANGIDSIINQFSLMSLIPGQIWSELGDICESEDHNGNRVIVFSHTLHFNLLGNKAMDPETCLSHTPYLSVPPTPFAGTPNVMSRFPSFHSAILARSSLTPAITINHPLRVKKAGSGTKWPISWLFSHLSPSKVTENMTKFDLKLLTRIQFNEQARIVTHEDIWGLKEILEFLAPSMSNQIYSLQRWLVGLCGDFLSQRYLRSPATRRTRLSTNSNRVQFSDDVSNVNSDHRRNSNVIPSLTNHSLFFGGSNLNQVEDGDDEDDEDDNDSLSFSTRRSRQSSPSKIRSKLPITKVKMYHSSLTQRLHQTLANEGEELDEEDDERNTNDDDHRSPDHSRSPSAQLICIGGRPSSSALSSSRSSGTRHRKP